MSDDTEHYIRCTRYKCDRCDAEALRRAAVVNARWDKARVAHDVAEADAYYAELKARLDERAPA